MLKIFIWPYQLVGIIVCWLSLFLIKHWLPLKWQQKFHYLDFLLIYLIFVIQVLSLQLLKLSLLPYLLFAAAILGIGLTLILAVVKGEIIQAKFWRFYWRLIELLTVSTYTVLIVLVILKKFN
ncbi:DUF3397 family protein [Liquorilactobacillus vini]|uniref:DUF3397 family protein n=2 Tax=Liquorilactobacillus vini TaxID=238015 RepID=UPI00029ABDFE|nr:DUF3397 family protein [Liquorilactobacillus vini]